MIASQASTGVIRALSSGDIASAFELSSIAGWNQTIGDWQMLLSLPGANCFAIEADGQVVSTTTLVCYGQRLAWIGMVLTRPEYRGRGFARRLFAHVLDQSESLGIETLKLDATLQGQPLYEQFGFSVEQRIERRVRLGEHNLYSSTSSPRLSEDLRTLDAEVFGADRSVLLDQLAKRGDFIAASNFFLFTRAGRASSYLGPCVASDPKNARALLEQPLSASDTVWSWDLLPENTNAVALAHEFGFTRERLLTRMSRGKVLRGRDDLVYAIAGFELG